MLVATVIRCITASSIELGNDEVYYRMYAQYPQWNYFDHPPAVGWLIRFSTINLNLDTELFIRLGAIASAAITTWLFFQTGKKLNDERTGFLAAALYTATVYGSVIAGTFILPDSPQMVCWAAALYLLTDIARYHHIGLVKKRKMFLFGVVAGIGMLCKVHTIFLWIGLLLYLLFYNRQWFRQPVLYLSGVITVLFFYPVIKWNIDNHFVTYLYHSRRVDVTGNSFNADSFLSFLGGQLLYCNPVVFSLFIPVTISAFKNSLPLLSSQKNLLLFTSLPLIFTASGLSLFKNVLPHWTGPAYSGLILLTAAYLGRQLPISRPGKIHFLRTLTAAFSFLFLLIFSGILLINFMPGTLGKKDDRLLGEGDFTLDMYGWDDLRTDFKTLTEEDKRRGIMKPGAVIFSNKWFPAAHLDQYVAMPLKMTLFAIGDTSDIHQYVWINSERKELAAGNDAYCIVPSNNYFDVPEKWGNSFTTVLPAQVIEQKRNGTICRKFYVWRLKGYHLK